jgi:hypothetical protein
MYGFTRNKMTAVTGDESKLYSQSVRMVEWCKNNYQQFSRGKGTPALITYSLIGQTGGLYKTAKLIPTRILPAKKPSGSRRKGERAMIEWKIRWDYPIPLDSVDPLMPYALEFHRPVTAVREGRPLKSSHLRGGINKNAEAMLLLYRVLWKFDGSSQPEYKQAKKIGTVQAARQLLTSTFGINGSWWKTHERRMAT